jgi:hypothetical protein
MAACIVTHVPGEGYGCGRGRFLVTSPIGSLLNGAGTPRTGYRRAGVRGGPVGKPGARGAKED